MNLVQIFVAVQAHRAFNEFKESAQRGDMDAAVRATMRLEALGLENMDRLLMECDAVARSGYVPVVTWEAANAPFARILWKVERGERK